jgi:hypothetical protein
MAAVENVLSEKNMLRRHLILAALAVAAAGPLAGIRAAEADDTARVESFADEASLDALAAGSGKTVVYFYAAWCPECRDLAVELKSRWSDVRPDINLVIADFDKDTALKARYGVTYQDTFVLLDKAGKPVRSWNGGGVDGLNQHTAG